MNEELDKTRDIGPYLFGGLITVLSLGSTTVAISMTRYVTAVVVGLPAVVWFGWTGLLATRGLVSVGHSIYHNTLKPKIIEVRSS